MSKQLDRRGFLKQFLLASAATESAFSFEEQSLLAANAKTKTPPGAPSESGESVNGLPAGKIKGVTISRIICGGNLIGGYAHSRDLIYVSPLLKHYFTEEKILETMEIAEENGINTIVLNNKQSDNLA